MPTAEDFKDHLHRMMLEAIERREPLDATAACEASRPNILHCVQDENYESATPAYSDTLWVGKP